jgi:hypothetical protein
VKLEQILEILQAEVIPNTNGEGVAVEMACGADLMSDVLSFAKPGALLLTGLTTPQVIYTMEMADIQIVCFVRGKRPPEETTRLAASKDMILLSTGLPMFESCGRLYKNGLKGCSET